MKSKRLSLAAAAVALTLTAIPAQPVAAQSTEAPASAASVKQKAVGAVENVVSNNCSIFGPTWCVFVGEEIVRELKARFGL
jgi:hypothetical protein